MAVPTTASRPGSAERPLAGNGAGSGHPGRRRMELILRVPALFAHSTLRFTAWREVVAEFVADRTGRRPGELAPQAIAHAVLGVSVAAYEHWLDHPAADLGVLLDDAMRQLSGAFQADAFQADAG